MILNKAVELSYVTDSWQTLAGMIHSSHQVLCCSWFFGVLDHAMKYHSVSTQNASYFHDMFGNNWCREVSKLCTLGLSSWGSGSLSCCKACDEQKVVLVPREIRTYIIDSGVSLMYCSQCSRGQPLYSHCSEVWTIANRIRLPCKCSSWPWTWPVVIFGVTTVVCHT